MGWGTLGGIAGGVAGFAASGGNPLGAAAGYSAGSSLGGMLGGGDSAGSRLSQADKMYGQGNRGDYGVPGYQGAFDQYGNMANGFGGRQAPQAAYSDFRNQQQGLGQQLMRESQGNGIGHQLIRQQAQGQADRGLRQQMGMAASARPGQGAAASRQAMMNAGNMNAQVGGQAASAQGQYQLGAMQNYGQFLSGARGQDESMNQFNADARLRQLGLNDRSQLDALGQRLQLQGMQQQGNMGYERDRTTRFGYAQGSPTQNEQTAGALQGAANAYLQYKAGQKPGKVG